MKDLMLIFELGKPNKMNRIYIADNFKQFLNDPILIIDNPFILEVNEDIPAERIIGLANIKIIDNKLYASNIVLIDKFKYLLNGEYNIYTSGVGETFTEVDNPGAEYIENYWLSGLYFSK